MTSIKTKTTDDVLLLGDERLYQVCPALCETDLDRLDAWVEDLRLVLLDCRMKYGFGRAIAAPQLGIMKRLIYLDAGRPLIILNPELKNLSSETFFLWDDCLSLPNLLVRVSRHRRLTLEYRDEQWRFRSLDLSDDLAELIQHEYDHLNGILCTMRAVDNRSFRWRI